jgi:hypothetical protein
VMQSGRRKGQVANAGFAPEGEYVEVQVLGFFMCFGPHAKERKAVVLCLLRLFLLLCV